MVVLNPEQKDRLLIEYGVLFKEFGWTLTKMDLGNILGVSERKIDTMVSSRLCPRFKKLGEAQNSRVIFFSYDVARWICDENN